MQGFPDHPHRGQATVTYMLEGYEALGTIPSRTLLDGVASCRSSLHEDSAGHKGKIEAGGVQWMCAVSPVSLCLIRNCEFSPGKPQGKGSEYAQTYMSK